MRALSNLEPASPLLDEPPALLARPNVWRASIPLETATPVVGGGVQSRSPDTIDVVRVSAIRGQLRYWWRVLYQKAEESADQLFAREAGLWGGLQVSVGDGEAQSVKSRVGVDVENLRPGTVEPAGNHELNQNRRPKSQPNWTAGQGLGYALFPLKKERAELQGKSNVVRTHSVRTGLKFHLNLTVKRPTRRDLQQVLAATWCSVHLGGLGARTRRGLGALKVSSGADLGTLTGTLCGWDRLFRTSNEDVVARLRAFVDIALPYSGLLLPIRVFKGPRVVKDAQKCLSELLGHLRYFRQQPGFARKMGHRRPGETRWPEAHLFRLLHGGEFIHPPPKDLRLKDLSAPRSGFGLPIEIQFTDQRGTPEELKDGRANGTLKPEQGERWASPLILCPFPEGSGYRAVALLLNEPPLGQVVAELAEPNRSRPVNVLGNRGARKDIATHLRGSEGDAVQAFTKWLCVQNGYTRTSIRGTRHV